MMNSKKYMIFLLIIGLSYSSYGQHNGYFSVGILIRTVHFKKLNIFGEKYQNWNLGVTAGYTTKRNTTIEIGAVRNSYNKLTTAWTIGKRVGDFEAQIGIATGYKSIDKGAWFRPGYFLNYEAEGLRIKANHEIINFGLSHKIY